MNYKENLKNPKNNRKFFFDLARNQRNVFKLGKNHIVPHTIDRQSQTFVR